MVSVGLLHRLDQRDPSEHPDDENVDTDHTHVAGFVRARTVRPMKRMMEAFKAKFRPPKSDLPLELLAVHRINRMFPVAANLSLAVYLLLLGSVYYFTPREQWQYLPEPERQAAWMAFMILVVSNALIVSRFAFHRKWKRHMGGIVYASMLCQGVAIVTNWLLACAPTVVLIDPITHSRVFLIRWCEWIPLAGLMTFFSEGVDITKETGGVKRAVFTSLSQSLSCLCGLLFPLCPNGGVWLCCLSVSIANFSVIFPRVAVKREVYREQRARFGHSSLVEREELDRLRFAYELMQVCAGVWAGLVIMYFGNFAAHRLLPEGHFLRYPSLAMVVDTTFDVAAKAIYLKLIVDIHFAVFDAEGRAQRQLGELRNLISVLWDASSDAIVISARHGHKVTSLLSPSFLKLVDVLPPPELQHRKSIALLIETEKHGGKSGAAAAAAATDPTPQSTPPPQLQRQQSHPQHLQSPDMKDDDDGLVVVLSCSYVDCAEIPYGGLLRESILLEVSSPQAREWQASGLIAAAWQHAEQSDSEVILMYQFQEERKCEVKVSPHTDNTLVAIVRDVTERYKRMEAERKAHSETVARQKDAQSVRRVALLLPIACCRVSQQTPNEMHAVSQLSVSRRRCTANAVREARSEERLAGGH